MTWTPAPENPPKDCTDQNEHRCPNMKLRDDTDMEAETYECNVCGRRYKLYYEDMA